MGDYAPLDYNPAYIQLQESAGCGRHALNNLLGGTYFTKTGGAAYTFDDLEQLGRDISATTPIDLQRICGYLQKSPKHTLDELDPCPASEYYNIEVLQFSLQIAGYKTDALYRNKEEGLDSFQKFVNDTRGTLGYIINYNKGHWVALHKNTDGYTYKNSIAGAAPPTEEQKAALISRFNDSKTKIPSTIALAQKDMSDEQALALAIQKSLEDKTVKTTITAGTGTTTQYNTIADYFTAYGVNIVSVVSVQQRASGVAQEQLLIENPGSTNTPDPNPPVTKSPIPKPKKGSTGLVSIGAKNFFTNKLIPQSFLDNYPNISKDAPDSRSEFDFLTKLSLINSAGKVTADAAVLYNKDGIFSVALDEQGNPLNTPENKPKLLEYLKLMSAIVLPRRIEELTSKSTQVSTDIRVGAQAEREIGEMNSYLIFLTNFIKNYPADATPKNNHHK